jgi:hypothetical protein
MAFDLSVDLCPLVDSARLEKRLSSSRRQPAQIVLSLSALAGYPWFIRLKVSQFGR